MIRGRRGFVQRFRFQPTSPADVLGPLAEAASDLFCYGDRTLIRRCGNPLCVLFFYDRTRNHGRRWCSARLCGNRLNVAAYYRRQRKRRRQ